MIHRAGVKQFKQGDILKNRQMKQMDIYAKDKEPGTDEMLRSYEHRMLFQKTQVPLPVATRQLTIICNSGSWELMLSSGLCRHLGLQSVPRHTCWQTLMHIKIK